MRRKLTEKEIDELVISQADDPEKWEELVLVKRSKTSRNGNSTIKQPRKIRPTEQVPRHVRKA